MLPSYLQDDNLWGGLCPPCPICASLPHPYPWGWGREKGQASMKLRARLDAALLHAGPILLPDHPIPEPRSHSTTRPQGFPSTQGFWGGGDGFGVTLGTWSRHCTQHSSAGHGGCPAQRLASCKLISSLLDKQWLTGFCSHPHHSPHPFLLQQVPSCQPPNFPALLQGPGKVAANWLKCGNPDWGN